MKTVKEIRELNEGMTPLPAMIVFKRRSIRMLPNGQQIAEYFSDQLNQTIIYPNSFSKEKK